MHCSGMLATLLTSNYFWLHQPLGFTHQCAFALPLMFGMKTFGAKQLIARGTLELFLRGMGFHEVVSEPMDVLK